MKQFRVRNWDKFQHYKDRNPPWIKLHTELLDNYEFSRLQDASKLLAVCIWLLAARSDNEIPADPEWIQRRCNLKTKPDLTPLYEAKFIEEIKELQTPEQDASSTLASCKQDACSEERQRRDREEAEGASAPPAEFDPATVKNLDAEAWRLWVEHRKKIKKPIRPHSMLDAAAELVKLGDRQLAEVKRARANGWQGIFPETPAFKPAAPTPIRSREFPT